MICAICNREFKSYKSLAMHIAQTHKINTKYYYDTYILNNGNNICKNENCNNITRFNNLNKGYSKYCCLKCNATSEKFIQMVKDVHIGKVSTTAGKTYEEIYGVEKAKKLKENRSLTHKNKVISEDQKEKIRRTRDERECGIGEKNGMFGKTHSSIVREKQRTYMLEGGASIARSGLRKISKPQKKLFKLISKTLPYPVLEYPCLNKSIDIAVPKLSIAFEYDDQYFHQDKEADIERQKLLEEEGWIFIRYVNRLPRKKELLNDVNRVLRIKQ